MGNEHLPQLPPPALAKSQVAPKSTLGLAPKRAHDRKSAANLSRLAKANGRCGDIDPITGMVCVTQGHGRESNHASMFIGGTRDGQITHEWPVTDLGVDQISGGP